LEKGAGGRKKENKIEVREKKNKGHGAAFNRVKKPYIGKGKKNAGRGKSNEGYYGEN